MTQPIALGTRTELFVDDLLIREMQGVELRLQTPVKREVVLEMNRSGETCAGYYNCFQDGDRIRLYYRGYMPMHEEGGVLPDFSPRITAHYAESRDGIHFVRPDLGLFEFEGSRANNIVWQGKEATNLFVFRDENPACKPDERYKAVGGMWEDFSALVSPDGLHWRRRQDGPLAVKGDFDSLNVVHWDPRAGCYRMFARYLKQTPEIPKFRAIQGLTSRDFVHWSDPAPHQYTDGAPLEQFYTNATVPCPGAEHILLSFPMRFVENRKKVETHPYDGVSDAVFMSSRDGIHWDRRFLEAWVRPDLDWQNWTERNNMPAAGIVPTSPAEFSMYISEHSRHPTNRLRRLSIRRHGFAAVHAGYAGGEFTTHPLTFGGSRLILNYATSAAGSVQVEIQEEDGRPIEGYAIADMPPLYGNELDASVAWKGASDLMALSGRPVRLRVAMKDADLFSLRFSNECPAGQR